MTGSDLGLTHNPSRPPKGRGLLPEPLDYRPPERRAMPMWAEFVVMTSIYFGVLAGALFGLALLLAAF